jgi:hypothetical protein
MKLNRTSFRSLSWSAAAGALALALMAPTTALASPEPGSDSYRRHRSSRHHDHHRHHDHYRHRDHRRHHDHGHHRRYDYGHRRHHNHFSIPRILSRALRHELRHYFYGDHYYAPHRHHHTIYRFPYYEGSRLTYRPYAYCEGRYYGVGRFSDHGLIFR